MAKRTKAQHADRVVNTVTGEMGTIVDTHTEVGGKHSGRPPNYGVLLDSGPRALVIWSATHAEWSHPPASRKCFRCGDKGHTAVTCPKGDRP